MLPFLTPGLDTLDLLNTLRHEFFTPLTVIEGYTSTLLLQHQQLAPDEHIEFVQMIQHAGRRLERLIQQLLEIAELEAGLLGLDAQPVNIAAIAGGVLTRAAERLPEPVRNRFTFALRCRDALGQPIAGAADGLHMFAVTGDEHRLRQVLEQLVENAIQYSPVGGRIDVIVRPAPSADATARVDQSWQGVDPANAALSRSASAIWGLAYPRRTVTASFSPFTASISVSRANGMAWGSG